MLNDADLGGIVGYGEETETVAGKRETFPNAPFPTHLRRIKWKRLTSASKSMTCEKNIRRWNAWRGGKRANLRTTAHSTHGDR